MNKAVLVDNVKSIKNMANFLINKCGFKPEEIQKFPNQNKGCQIKKKRK